MKKIDIFIEDMVWESNIKYLRMMLKTKEKFFEYLNNEESLKKYAKGIKELWNVDHSYMDKAIKELDKMVSELDISDYEKYEKPLTKQQSVKLTNGKLYYYNYDKKQYPLNPESDFRKIEQQFANRIIKLYSRYIERIKEVPDKESYLSNIVKTYDKQEKTIPYYHKDGTIKCYNTVATYNSMLYNWNLTHSAWNRTEYDAEVLDNHLYYLPAHPHACPLCSEYQGYVYADKKGLGYPLKEDAIEGGVGHPNCQHVWTLYWDKAQIQDEKYNSPEDIEEYKTRQKIQSLDLEKARLLSDRRIYKNLGDQEMVDKTTSKIKKIREKKKELE